MKKLLLRFQYISIKKQFFIVASLSAAILCLLCILVRFAMHGILLQTNEEYVETLTDKFETEISSVYQQAENICTQIQYNIAAVNLLEADSYQKIDAATINAVSTQKASIFWLNDAIVDIAFYNDLVHWSSVFSARDLEIMHEKVSSRYGTTAMGIHYSSAPTRKELPYFVFSSSLFSNYERIGTIFISFDLNKSNIQLPDTNHTNSWFLLYDGNKQITPFNCSQEVSKEIFDSCRDYIDSAYSGADVNFSHSLLTDSYMIRLAYLENTDSYIISAIDISTTNTKLQNVYTLIWGIVIICILFHLILGAILYLNFIAPLNQFNQVITHIKEKKLRRLDRPLHLKGCREVRNIGEEFADLLVSIHDLNGKIMKTSNALYEVELQRKIAELSYLKSQINPHFLYNTLDLIRSLSFDHHVPEVADIAVSMGKILRYSIKGEEFVTLEQELDITQAYINIQLARFAGKITVITNISAAAKNRPVMKMLLQPLVENAIFYGLEPKDGNGILYISGYVEEKQLIITVRDDGIGITADTLSSIQKELSSELYDTSRHVGLVNTNARIRLQYGTGFGLTISSICGDGTCVTISLPVNVNEIKKGEHHVSGSFS